MKKSNQRDCLFPKPSSGEFVSQNLVQASLLLKSYFLPSPSLTDLIVFLYAPVAAAAAAKSCQSCPTLCDPLDSSPPGSSVPGILQARTLVCSLSNTWKWKVKVKSLSRVQLLATPWTAAYQAPPSMGFSRQEYWSGLPLPSPVCSCRILFMSLA